MPSKPAKYGIKWWLCCDSDNAYICDLDIYVGKARDGTVAKRVGETVVTNLTQSFKGSGRNITMDNFFTSVPLAKTLLRDNLTLVGTVRKNKTEIPVEFMPHKKRNVRSSTFGFDGDLTLVSYVPKTNRAVILLSTMHHTNVVDGGEEKKPEIVLDYNATKGGVDTADQLIRTYSVKRKTNRWPVVCFFNVLDIAALNGMIIWILNNPEWEVRRRYKRRLYLKQLARSLVAPWTTARANQPHSGSVRRAMLAAGFQVVVQKKQERDGAKKDVVFVAKRMTEKHSTDAASATNRCTCLTVHLR